MIDARGFVDLFDEPHAAPDRPDPAGPRADAVARRSPRTARTLAITTDAGTLEFWDTRTRRPLGEPQIAHALLDAEALTFSADGRWLATGGDDPIVRLWDARAPDPVGSVADTAARPTSASAPTARCWRSPCMTELQRRPRDPLRAGPRADQDGAAPGRHASGASRATDARWSTATATDACGRSTRAPGSRAADPLSAGASDRQRRPQPRRSPARDDLHRRHGPPVGPRDAPPDRRHAVRRSGDPIGAAFIRGGSHLAVVHERRGRRVGRPSGARGRATPARSPGARSRARSGRALLPDRAYAPACGRP